MSNKQPLESTSFENVKPICPNTQWFNSFYINGFPFENRGELFDVTNEFVDESLLTYSHIKNVPKDFIQIWKTSNITLYQDAIDHFLKMLACEVTSATEFENIDHVYFVSHKYMQNNEFIDDKSFIGFYVFDKMPTKVDIQIDQLRYCWLHPYFRGFGITITILYHYLNKGFCIGHPFSKQMKRCAEFIAPNLQTILEIDNFTQEHAERLYLSTVFFSAMIMDFERNPQIHSILIKIQCHLANFCSSNFMNKMNTNVFTALEHTFKAMNTNMEDFILEHKDEIMEKFNQLTGLSLD